MLKSSSGLVVEINSYLETLFPIHRSLTGEGNRESLRILSQIAPIEMMEYPCGAKVFDWAIPPEWKVRDTGILHHLDGSDLA